MKYFTVNIKGCKEVISINCLKPAYLDSDTSLPDNMPPPNPQCLGDVERNMSWTVTCLNRDVHWPQQLPQHLHWGSIVVDHQTNNAYYIIHCI